MTIFKESQVAPNMTNINKDAPTNATETKYALIGAGPTGLAYCLDKSSYRGAVTGWIKALGGKSA